MATTSAFSISLEKTGSSSQVSAGTSRAPRVGSRAAGLRQPAWQRQVGSRTAALVVLLCLAACSGDRGNHQVGAGETAGRWTLCGSVLVQKPIIAPDGIGPIDITQSMEKLRSLCPEIRDTVVGGQHMLTIRALGSVIVAGLSVEVGPNERDSSPIDFIAIVGGELRTSEKVGPGSTLGEVRRAYGPAEYLGCDGRIGRVVFSRSPTLHFVFADCTRLQSVQLKPADDTLRVRSVEVIIPT